MKALAVTSHVFRGKYKTVLQKTSGSPFPVLLCPSCTMQHMSTPPYTDYFLRHTTVRNLQRSLLLRIILLLITGKTLRIFWGENWRKTPCILGLCERPVVPLDWGVFVMGDL